MIYPQKTLESLVDVLVGAGTPRSEARITVDVANHATGEAFEAVRRVLSTLDPDQASSALIVTLRMLAKACDDEGRKLMTRSLLGDYDIAYNWILKTDQP